MDARASCLERARHISRLCCDPVTMVPSHLRNDLCEQIPPHPQTEDALELRQ